MKLAIILLNWNAATDTIRCVQNISAWRHLRPDIWVLDNASTDDSIDLIAKHCPTVHLIRSETNLGYAGGNNRLIKEALKSEATSILLFSTEIQGVNLSGSYNLMDISFGSGIDRLQTSFQEDNLCQPPEIPNSRLFDDER